MLSFKSLVNWYRQETEGTPYFIYQACRGCLNWFKDKTDIYWFLSLDSTRGYLGKEKIRKLAEKYFELERKAPGSFKKMFFNWKKIVCDRNEKIFAKIENSDLKNSSDINLLYLNEILARQSFVMWSQIFIDIYDLDAESLVKREIVEKNVKLSEQDINTLMSQEKLLTYQRAERDLLKIVELVKKTSGATNVFLYISAPENLHRLDLFPVVRKEIQKYQHKYFWMYNSWAHCRYLSEFEIVDNIKQILVGPRVVGKELKELVNFEKNIILKKNKILRERKCSIWIKQIFVFFSILVFWRDERKVQMQRMNYYFELLGKEIARRSRLNWEEVKMCDPLAIAKLPVNKTLIKKHIKIWKERPVMQWQGKVVHLDKVLSKKVEQTIENSINSAVSEIRGMIACPGKVEGEVLVINKKEDFVKMQPGKILVTVMTRPEFVPLMKKAAGIITDEGGVTSHAAVISRELKVPCIIGTQVATKKLKDGDRVFVNADHGIVILK